MRQGQLACGACVLSCAPALLAAGLLVLLAGLLQAGVLSRVLSTIPCLLPLNSVAWVDLHDALTSLLAHGKAVPPGACGLRPHRGASELTAAAAGAAAGGAVQPPLCRRCRGVQPHPARCLPALPQACATLGCCGA